MILKWADKKGSLLQQHKFAKLLAVFLPESSFKVWTQLKGWHLFLQEFIYANLHLKKNNNNNKQRKEKKKILQATYEISSEITVIIFEKKIA